MRSARFLIDEEGDFSSFISYASSHICRSSIIHLHLRKTASLIDPLMTMVIDSLAYVIINSPQEYVSFGNYGCQADCGSILNMTQIQVELVPD